MTKKLTWTRGVVGAMLLVGFASAHAQLMIEGATSVTYAKETLLKGDDNTTMDAADMMYYNIAASLEIVGEADIAANAGDVYTVSFELDGMVFTDGTAATLAGTTAAFTRSSGGAEGENEFPSV